MNRKVKISIFFVVIVVLLLIASKQLYTYKYRIDINFDANAKQQLEEIVDQLKVYNVYDLKGKEINLARLGQDNDGGYIIPPVALKNSDVLLGYGVRTDMSFEEAYSDHYNKPSYGFDCGVTEIKLRNPLTKFISQCISTDTQLDKDQISTKKITGFKKQLKELQLENKRIFIKMDIEGAEYQAMKEVINYHDYITGIAMEIHFFASDKWRAEALNMLKDLNKYFYVVHLHPNNHAKNVFQTSQLSAPIPDVVEVTFINKNLVSQAELAKNKTFPINIDQPCSAKKKDYQFSFVDS